MKRLILMVVCMALAVLGVHAKWMTFGKDVDGDVWYIDSRIENGEYGGYVVWVKRVSKHKEYIKGKRVAEVKMCWEFKEGLAQYDEIAVYSYDSRGVVIDSWEAGYHDWSYPIPGSIAGTVRDLTRDALKTGRWNIDYTPDEEETPDTSQTLSEDVKVWVCSGGSSTTYHSRKDCKGLRRCSRSVVQMSAVSAEEKGKRACKLCY